MNKLYDRIFFENDTTPALNETNLNAISKAIDDIDDRVVELGTDVLETVPHLQELAEEIEEYLPAIEEAGPNALIAEGMAVGKQNGEDVGPESEYYHNNAKYYSQLANPTALANMSDVNVEGVTDGKVLKYDGVSAKWIPGEGGGSASVATLSDVTLSTLSDGDVLVYDNVTSKWVNSNVIGNISSALDAINGEVV